MEGASNSQNENAHGSESAGWVMNSRCPSNIFWADPCNRWSRPRSGVPSDPSKRNRPVLLFACIVSDVKISLGQLKATTWLGKMQYRAVTHEERSRAMTCLKSKIPQLKTQRGSSSTCRNGRMIAFLSSVTWLYSFSFSSESFFISPASTSAQQKHQRMGLKERPVDVVRVHVSRRRDQFL